MPLRLFSRYSFHSARTSKVTQTRFGLGHLKIEWKPLGTLGKCGNFAFFVPYFSSFLLNSSVWPWKCACAHVCISAQRQNIATEGYYVEKETYWKLNLNLKLLKKTSTYLKIFFPLNIVRSLICHKDYTKSGFLIKLNTFFGVHVL